MKKILLSLFLLFYFSCPIVSAFNASNLDQNRWYWVGSNSEETVYVDKKTLDYNPSTDTITAYISWVYPSQNVIAIHKVDLYCSTNKAKFYDGYKYIGNNPNPYQANTNNNIMDVLPETLAEKLMNVVPPLVGRDQKRADYLAAKKKTFEDAEKQKKKEEKEIKDQQSLAAIGSILGAFWR